MTNDVHLFWDNSNIFISARKLASDRDGVLATSSIRINFQSLYDLAKAGRNVASAVCVGSVPPELDSVWDHLRSTGVNVELYERGKESGREQGIDQCLQVHMLRTLSDHNPSIAVLLTGDGAGYMNGVGFHADLERLKQQGWGIEVLSWDISCNSRLKEWAQRDGVYVPLEDYYDSVTFIQGGRRSSNLSLTKRELSEIPK